MRSRFIPGQPLAEDQEIAAEAIHVREMLPLDTETAIQHFLLLVPVNFDPSLDRHIDTLYVAFAPVRNIIKEKYGSTVKLYRGEPESITGLRSRKFLSWSPSRDLSAGFAEARDHHLISAFVRVNDVLAVVVGQDGYVEYLVLDRPEYHKEGRRLPLIGEVYLGYDSTEERDLPRVLAAIEAAGGELVRVKHDTEAVEGDDYVSFIVALPPGTPTLSEYGTTRADVNGLRVEGIRPWGRGLRREKWM